MEEKMLYKDASQPVEARVEDLLSRMTLEEKAAQLCGVSAGYGAENRRQGVLQQPGQGHHAGGDRQRAAE